MRNSLNFSPNSQVKARLVVDWEMSGERGGWVGREGGGEWRGDRGGQNFEIKNRRPAYH